MVVNTQKTKSITYGSDKSAGASLQLNRRLSQSGRNVTLRGEMSLKDSKSTSLSLQDVHLYLLDNHGTILAKDIQVAELKQMLPLL